MFEDDFELERGGDPSFRHPICKGSSSSRSTKFLSEVLRANKLPSSFSILKQNLSLQTLREVIHLFFIIPELSDFFH